MKKKVLFTGNGNFIIDDIREHFPAGYQTCKCPPIETAFRNTLATFRPHVTVICLSKETRATFQAYSILEEDKHFKNIPVIVIGNSEDCEVFNNGTLLKNMEVFVRPLDIKRFMSTLDKFIELTANPEENSPDKGKIGKNDMTKNSADFLSGQDPASWDLDPQKDSRISKNIENLNRIYGRKNILVVDDDVRMLNVIKLYLQDLYNVTVVPSGKLALKYLAKKPADLVLLDYMMPEEDGPAVLRQIRFESPVPHIPVIFLTGVSDKDKVLKGLELLPNAYLLKPINRDLLLEKVTEVLLGLQ